MPTKVEVISIMGILSSANLKQEVLATRPGTAGLLPKTSHAGITRFGCEGYLSAPHAWSTPVSIVGLEHVAAITIKSVCL